MIIISYINVNFSLSYKTTILLHYAYLLIQIYEFDNPNEDNIHGVILCNLGIYTFNYYNNEGNEAKIRQNEWYFGKYSTVAINTLQKIQLKYVSNFSDITDFLVYWRLMEKKPKFVFIDDLMSYFKQCNFFFEIQSCKRFFG